MKQLLIFGVALFAIFDVLLVCAVMVAAARPTPKFAAEMKPEPEPEPEPERERCEEQRELELVS